MFRLTTGLQCPGCGVSRMCLALLRLDFAGAWRANPAVLSLLPAGAAVALNMTAAYIRTGWARPSPWANILLWGMIGVLVVFGLARNFI